MVQTATIKELELLAGTDVSMMGWLLKITGIAFTILFTFLAISVLGLRYEHFDGWLIFAILLWVGYNAGFKTWQRFRHAKRPR